MPKSIYTERQALLCRIIIESRQAAGLTQQEVADRLHQPQSFVAKIEGGERRLDVIEFIEVCEKLETDPQLLFKRLVKRT